MTLLQKKYGLLTVGILIGIIYGLLTRLAFDATLASATYLFLIPTILGIVPLMFADDQQLRSFRTIIFIPCATVISFFLTMFLMGLEGFICLFVLAGPFFILGILGAVVFRFVQLNRRKNRGILLSVMFIPFLISPVEQLVKSPSLIFEVESEILISATPATIWNNIVEVKAIQEVEYSSGLFNKIGVPRPINATVDRKELEGHRTGHFEGGLKFIEVIKTYEPNKLISFDITVDPKSVGSNVFDQHVLSGDYFTFVDAAYELKDLGDGQVKLKLSSSYQLTSKVNFYGRFWGNIILKDFQDRLLKVIEFRCEKE